MLTRGQRVMAYQPEAVRAMLILYASMACICFTLSVRNEAPQFREKFINRVVRWNKTNGCRHSYK